MPRKPKAKTQTRKNQKDNPKNIRITIFVDNRTYDWLVRTKRASGQTYGGIVNQMVKNEVTRKRNTN